MVDPDIARALRRHGVDVMTTVEAGLRTKSDAEQLAYAVGEHRVIVTHDADYLRLAVNSRSHPGIAYCALGSRTIGQIVEHLIAMFEVLEPDEMVGRVEYL